jgi:glycosyltransferase involved in cell wall biosynthesis
VDRFVAISGHVRDRIRRFYGRESDVVYPFVDCDRCTPGGGNARGDFDLIVSALVPYKRTDLAVEAYRKTGFPLVIAGAGTEFERLRRGAPSNVSFAGWKSDAEVLDLYRRCRLLVFPGEEDFGIVPLEAQACGKPVVAFGRGGALETVRDGETGVFFADQTPEALGEAVARCASKRWNSAAIRSWALEFGPDRFIDGMETVIARTVSS